MGVLDDAFTDLAAQVVGQLARGTITIRRQTRGTLNTTSLARVVAHTDCVIAAVRGAARASFERLGDGGGEGAMEEWDYLVLKSALVDDAAAAFVPVEGDLVLDAVTGSTLTHRISMVSTEVDERMVKITVRGMRQK